MSRFCEHERRLLLCQPGIGPSVVERLEQVGVDNLAKLKSQGVDRVVEEVCRVLGRDGWANRKGPLRRALAQLSINIPC